MSKVVRIDSHPKFSRLRVAKPVELSPIVGLDGGLIDNEFMEEWSEAAAVARFLCDMGFIVHPSHSNRERILATFKNSEFPSDWICFEVPPSFSQLLYVCGIHAFKNKELTYPPSVHVGKLGAAASQAFYMWQQRHRPKTA